MQALSAICLLTDPAANTNSQGLKMKTFTYADPPVLKLSLNSATHYFVAGQNPGSSAATAKSVVEYLSKASA